MEEKREEITRGEIVFHEPSAFLDKVKDAPTITDPERIKENEARRAMLEKLAEKNRRLRGER